MISEALQATVVLAVNFVSTEKLSFFERVAFNYAKETLALNVKVVLVLTLRQLFRRVHGLGYLNGLLSLMPSLFV